jgi:hypothetical protein
MVYEIGKIPWSENRGFFKPQVMAVCGRDCHNDKSWGLTYTQKNSNDGRSVKRHVLFSDHETV